MKYTHEGKEERTNNARVHQRHIMNKEMDKDRAEKSMRREQEGADEVEEERGRSGKKREEDLILLQQSHTT